MKNSMRHLVNAAWLALGALACAPCARAHHSFAATFDVTQTIEIEGRITDVRWQNPHVLMKLETATGTQWQVESQAKNLLERTEVQPAMFPVGAAVSLAGYPARDGNGIFALNALLPDGREVILRAGIAPRWNTARANRPENILQGGIADANATGLFRVWSMQFAGEGRWRWPDKFPLTPTAAAAFAAFDPIEDNVLRGCAKKGMPWIMEQPFPMQIAEQGSDVVLRLEENDVVRVVHMTGAPQANPAPSALGYSVGRWENGDLVVRTTAIDFPYLNATGVPQSDAIELAERFSPAADGSRLNYTLTITDPATFTEPVTLSKYWVWTPGVRLQPYECAIEQ
jgi:hypothetical protein